jgi:hypothetical protein
MACKLHPTRARCPGTYGTCQLAPPCPNNTPTKDQQCAHAATVPACAACMHQQRVPRRFGGGACSAPVLPSSSRLLHPDHRRRVALLQTCLPAHMHGTTMCCKYSQPTAPLNLHCQTRSNAPSLPAAVRVLLRYMQSFHPQPRLQSSLKVGHPVTPCPPVAVYAKTPACWCMDVCCPDKSSWE